MPLISASVRKPAASATDRRFEMVIVKRSVARANAKVVPITIVLAIVFSVLSYFWACNPGAPWWRKRELVTDICYWFFVPLFARVLRIGLLVLGAGLVFNIQDADTLIAFYENGHGPLSELPLWWQGLFVFAVSDFVLCFITVV